MLYLGPTSEPPISLIGKRVVDFLFAIIELFSLALTADALTSKSPLLKGRVNLGLNIRLKGYVYRQHIYTIRYENGSATNLPLEVFTQRNFVAEFIRFNLIFIHKNDTVTFWATLRRLSGDVRTSSIGLVRWKARVWLPIRDNWTYFASSYGWDVLSKYSSKSALFRGGGSQILGGRGRRSQRLLVYEN